MMHRGVGRRRGSRDTRMVRCALAVACALTVSIAVPSFAEETTAVGAGDEPGVADHGDAQSDQEPSPRPRGSHLRMAEQVTVTATKTDTPSDRMPVTAYSVSQAEVEAQPSHYMSNVGELIRDLPGTHVAQYYPWGPPWVHLRGTGYFIGRTAYLVDGIPITPFLSSTIHNAAVERVDVVLGPASALYGANASGGAVNIVTASAAPRGTAARLGFGLGSFGTLRPHADLAGRTARTHYYLAYDGDHSDGYAMKPVSGMVDLYNLRKTQYLWDASLEPNRYDYSYGMAKAGWTSGRGASLTATYSAQWLDLYGGQPGMVLNDGGRQAIGSLHAVVPLSRNAKLTARLGWQDLTRPQRATKGLSLQDGVVVLDATPTSRSAWTLDRLPAEVQVDYVIADRHILTGGLFWSREHEVRDDFLPSTGARTSRSAYTTDQTAFYLQGQAALLDERLSLLGGVRRDGWRFFDIFDQASSPQEPGAIEKDHTTFRVGAKLRAGHGVAIRSSFGTAFWPGTPLWFFRNVSSGMTWREANPSLDPEKTWMADLGLDLFVARTGTVAGITPYVGRIDDMVSYRYDVNPEVEGGTIIRSLNLGRASIRGAELAVDQRLGGALSIAATLTLNRSRLQESGANTDNQLRNAPDYFGSLSLRYAHPDVVNAQATLRFSDDRFYDDDNTDLPYFHMEAYQTVDLKLWREWTLFGERSLTTAVSCVNLLDKEYATEIVYVHPGRTLQADVRLRLPF